MTFQMLCPTCGRACNAKTLTDTARFECRECGWIATVSNLPGFKTESQLPVCIFSKLGLCLTQGTNTAADPRDALKSAGTTAGSLILPATGNADKEH